MLRALSIPRGLSILGAVSLGTHPQSRIPGVLTLGHGLGARSTLRALSILGAFSMRPGILAGGVPKGEILLANSGKGTFGTIHPATNHKHGGAQVVIKVVKLATFSEKIAEIYALELCARHPNIVQLLDVTTPRTAQIHLALVFEEWGEDLRRCAPRVAKMPVQVRQILLDVTSGLAHLHSVGLIHSDLKPANILVKAAAGPGELARSLWAPIPKLASKVCDLASCVAAAVDHRPVVNSGAPCSRERWLRRQTLDYRAPEMLLGCECFGAGVDAWALGIIAAELGGFAFTKASHLSVSGATVEAYAQRIFEQLGMAGGEELQTLPLFKSLLPPGSALEFQTSAAKPWPEAVRGCLGALGFAFLRELLALSPSKRLRMREALSCAFFDHDAFPLFLSAPNCDNIGFTAPEFLDRRCFLREAFYRDSSVIDVAHPCSTVVEEPHCRLAASGFRRLASSSAHIETLISGGRHDWAIRVGVLSPEVLQFILADDALCPGKEAFQNLEVSFEKKKSKKSPSSRSESGRKHITAGRLSDCSRTTMCGMSLKEVLPVPAICAWKVAFDNVNATLMAEADAKAKDLMRHLDEKGNNGVHFLQQRWRSYWCTCAELTFSDSQGEWEEELHNDGLMSVLHIGLTLYGRRYLEMHDADGHVHSLLNEPGSVYMGSLTGPRHQVRHAHAEAHELLQVEGLGNLSSTVMMRSSLFPHDGGYVRNAPATPSFLCLARSFSRSIAQSQFRLPTLADCRDAFAELFPERVAASHALEPPRKRYRCKHNAASGRECAA